MVPERNPVIPRFKADCGRTNHSRKCADSSEQFAVRKGWFDSVLSWSEAAETRISRMQSAVCSEQFAVRKGGFACVFELGQRLRRHESVG